MFCLFLIHNAQQVQSRQTLDIFFDCHYNDSRLVANQWIKYIVPRSIYKILNKHFNYYNSLGFDIISYSLIIGLLCYMMLLKLLIKYRASIHHTICFFIFQATYQLLSIPIFYNFIYKAHIFDQQVHYIIILLSIGVSLLFITLNCQISIIEGEGSYCEISDELLLYFTRLFLCISKIQFPIVEVQLSTLMIINTFLLLRSLQNSFNFNVDTRIIKVIFCLAGLFNFSWIEIIIIYLLIKQTIISIQKYYEDSVLMNITNCNKTQIKLLIQRVCNYYLQSDFIKIILIEEYLKNNSKTLLSRISQENIQNRILIERYFDKNINKLHLSLIKMKREGLSYLDYVYVQANLHKIAQFYNQSHNTQYQELIFKILQAEQDNLDIFDKILQLRLGLFSVLQKNISNEQSQDLIIYSCLRYCEKMETMKLQLEENIDFKNLILRNTYLSDYITLQSIQMFYMIFFANSQKAIEITFRMKELTNWNRNLNFKLKNSKYTSQLDLILLFQISHLMQKGKILNNNSRSLRESFLNIENFQQILPIFLKDQFNALVQNYISSGFTENTEQNSFLLQNQFLIPCKITFYHSMANDDLILNKIVELENQEDFLLFNRQGKIIGLTNQVFLALKEANNFNNYQEFLEMGLIQEFIEDIQYQIYLLISSQNSQHKFKSIWNQFEIHQRQSKSNVRFCQQDLLKYTINSNSLEPESLSINFMNKQKELTDGNALLCFNFELSFKEPDEFLKEGYFTLKFLDLKNFYEQTEENKDIVSENVSQIQKSSSIQFNQQTLIESILQRKRLSMNLIMQAITLCGITIYALLTLCLNNSDSENEIVSYQNSINFLINPQALTFSLAAAFLLQWNNYCAQNQLYNLSNYVEFQRQQKLKYAYRLWVGININYTLNLSIRSQELGLGQVQVIDYDANNNKIIAQVEYYSFYTIIREKLVRVFLNTNFTNISTTGYSIFKANGFIRQNILTVFKYHDFVMNNEIDQLVQKVRFSQQRFEIILSLEIFLLVPLSVFLIRLILNQNKLMNKIFRLIYHIDQFNIQISLDQTKLLYDNLLSSKKYLIYQEQFENKEPQQKKNNLLKNHSFQPFSKIGISVPIFCTIFYLGLMMGVLYYRTSYYSKYQDSLLMTMNYIKFKKHFDTSILLGELIKTEHLIPQNPYYLINQTDTVQYFFSQANNATVIFNEILENLISSTYFNATMKQTILSAFKDNLCINFAKFLPFCNVTNIKLTYKYTDTYTGLIQNGIGGIIQNYNNLIQQEFNQESITQSYDFDLVHSKQYLNSQLHQNFFVQYAQDIQSCFFTCFSYFISESRSLGKLFISVLSQYYIASGIMHTLLLFIISPFWIIIQYQKIQMLKFVLTLLNPQLLGQKLIYQQLMNIYKQL